jgi:type II secretory pathway pseudopilin PulG
MRSLIVLALLAASCKKDSGTSSPGAPPSTKEQDALWELAPSSAKLGIVVSGRGVAMIEGAWFAVRELIASARELEGVDDKLERELKRVIGTSDLKLSSLGLTADQGAALFMVDEEEVVVILPVVDREKFLDKVKGKKGPDHDRVKDMTCTQVGERYACAKPKSLLDKLGKGKLFERLEPVGARGDIEIAGTIPTERGKAPRIAAVGQLGRGAIVVRGEIDGIPDKVADMFEKPFKPRSDGNKTSGFASFDPRPFLDKVPRGKVVRGVTTTDLAEAIAGPITVTTPNGAPTVDIRVPLSDVEPFEKLISRCDEIRPLAKLGAKADDDMCRLTLPEVGLEVEAWIDGKQLRIGRKKSSSSESSPMSTIGEEIADGEWSVASWGHGTMFAYDDAPFLQSIGTTRAPTESLISVRAIAMVSEIGLAAKVSGNKAKFIATVRTVWSNPDEVVARLTKIKIDDLLRGRTAKVVKEIASDHPNTPFAADHTAGPGGLVAMLAPIGIASAVAIPMFLDTMKKAKKSEAHVQLAKIEAAAKSYYHQNGTFPIGEVEATPARPCCGQSARNKCVPDPAVWSNRVWQSLDFQIDEEHLFQYAYRSDGKTFTATAIGDLDCDTVMIEYRAYGTAEGGQVRVHVIDPPPNSD